MKFSHLNIRNLNLFLIKQLRHQTLLSNLKNKTHLFFLEDQAVANQLVFNFGRFLNDKKSLKSLCCWIARKN
jgi:hypothetical protein